MRIRGKRRLEAFAIRAGRFNGSTRRPIPRKLQSALLTVELCGRRRLQRHIMERSDQDVPITESKCQGLWLSACSWLAAARCHSEALPVTERYSTRQPSRGIHVGTNGLRSWREKITRLRYDRFQMSNALTSIVLSLVAGTAFAASDPHSYADTSQFVVRHVSLDMAADFTTHRLQVLLDIDR